MKRLITAALAAVCMSAVLAGCASTGSANLTPAKVSEDTLLAAESAFNVAATAEEDAKASGVLAGAKATKADADRHQAYQVLLTLRAAYKAGQTLDPTALLALTNDMLTLAGKAPVPANAPTVGSVVQAVPPAVK